MRTRRSPLVVSKDQTRVRGCRRLGVAALAAFACALAGSLLGATAASANLELVKSFANGGLSEGGQLSESGNPLAINQHTGDLYEADDRDSRVLRFNAHGEFLEAWGWGVGDGEEKFERCGLDGEPFFPECPGRSSQETGVAIGQAWRGQEPGEFQFQGVGGIAVDQASGDVYVLSGHKVGTVQVFSESGELLTSFANMGPGETEVEGAGPMAVDGLGDVYVATHGGATGARVVEYVKKSATEYAYSREVLHGLNEVFFLDIAASGSLFAASFTRVLRFEPPNFTTAAWEHPLTTPEGVSINPENGEVFYYGKANKFHEFKPHGQNEVENKAGEAGQEELFAGLEQEEYASSSAYDPAAEELGHGRGIFYAHAPSNDQHSGTRNLLFAQPAGAEPPVIEGENLGSVGTTSAELTAVLDDKGFAGQYQLEYGLAPCASGGCATTPPVAIAAAGAAQHVSATISGLEPATPYYFRATVSTHCDVAEPTKECIVHGSDETFTTLASSSGGGGGGPSTTAGLPDGRAYELVSPPDKHGGEVFGLDPSITSCAKKCEPGSRNSRQPAESASDGSAVAYEGFPFSPSGEAVNENEYRSLRTATGWQTVDLTPELESPKEPGYRALSDGLDEGILSQSSPPALAPEVPTNIDQELYLRQSDGILQPLLSTKAGSYDALENPLALVYEGASSGLGDIVFGANDSLTPETEDAPAAPKVSPTQFDLYAWSKGAPTLVNVAPGNTESVPGAVLGSGKQLTSSESAPDYSNAVSSDGTRIFWSNEATGQVYVRLNGVETLQVPDSGKFLTANSDGSTVLLSDGKTLSVTEAGISPSVDLSGGQGGFLGILGTSSTLSHVYFVDTAKLTNEEGAAHTVAQAGADNLYVYSEGETRFVATLVHGDNLVSLNAVAGDWKASPSDRLAQVTPDGRYLAFMSTARLTGYDNDEKNGSSRCGQSFTTGCFEVFEYSWEAGTLVCASCNAANVQPVGESRLSLIDPISSISPFPQPRNLTAGGRLFFESFDALTSGDRAPGVKNVYEYERYGEGSCGAADGCVDLISSGRGTADSSFLSADETGANVFFTTREQLTPEDEDEASDVYDARVGGGFPRPTSPEPCRGEACMPPSLSGLVAMPPPTSQSLPAESPLGTSPATAPATARVTTLHASLERGTLHLTLAISAAGTVRVTGRLTKTLAAKLAAGRRESLVVRLTRAGRRAHARHRMIVLTVAIQIGQTRVVRKVTVR
jgi:hypothetical protein